MEVEAQGMIPKEVLEIQSVEFSRYPWLSNVMQERSATDRELPWYVRLNEYESLSGGFDTVVGVEITVFGDSAFWADTTFLLVLKHRNFLNHVDISIRMNK